MKKTFKRILCLVMAAALVMALAGCAKINYVTNGTIGAIREVKSGEWENGGSADGAADGADANSEADTPKIEELKPGTYGGVDFKTMEDVAKYYVEAYNYSKTLMAKYKDDQGEIRDWYKIVMEEDLKIENIKIDGKANSTINNLAPTIVGGIYKPGLNGLVPSTNRDPKLDTDEWDGNGESLTTSRLVADDLLAANVKDNGDGTITMQLQPKAVNMSAPGKDAQGHVFQSLGAIDSTVDQISQLSWSSGTTAENCVVDYKDGVATVTINTKTKEITAADYSMKAYVKIQHANILVIKDKSASVDITMQWKYPASDDYLMKSRQVSRA